MQSGQILKTKRTKRVYTIIASVYGWCERSYIKMITNIPRKMVEC